MWPWGGRISINLITYGTHHGCFAYTQLYSSFSRFVMVSSVVCIWYMRMPYAKSIYAILYIIECHMNGTHASLPFSVQCVGTFINKYTSIIYIIICRYLMNGRLFVCVFMILNDIYFSSLDLHNLWAHIDSNSCWIADCYWHNCYCRRCFFLFLAHMNVLRFELNVVFWLFIRLSPLSSMLNSIANFFPLLRLYYKSN